MNGYQRIITALKGEHPDTIPVMLHNFMMAAKEAGYSQAEYRADPPGFAVGKLRHLVGCFARLGMSPSDRAGLGVTEQSSGEYDNYPIA